jgi:BASS family bile acid:Na+ symporter
MSLGVIVMMVVGGAGAGRIQPTAYGWSAPAAAFAMALVFTQVAQLATRLGGLVDRDRAAVGIEVTLRNTNLALLVKASLFPAVAGVPDPIGDGMFFMALIYGGLQLVATGVPVLFYRRRLRAAPLHAPSSMRPRDDV